MVKHRSRHEGQGDNACHGKVYLGGLVGDERDEGFAGAEHEEHEEEPWGDPGELRLPLHTGMDWA